MQYMQQQFTVNQFQYYLLISSSHSAWTSKRYPAKNHQQTNWKNFSRKIILSRFSTLLTTQLYREAIAQQISISNNSNNFLHFPYSWRWKLKKSNWLAKTFFREEKVVWRRQQGRNSVSCFKLGQQLDSRDSFNCTSYFSLSTFILIMFSIQTNIQTRKSLSFLEVGLVQFAAFQSEFRLTLVAKIARLRFDSNYTASQWVNQACLTQVTHQSDPPSQMQPMQVAGEHGRHLGCQHVGHHWLLTFTFVKLAESMPEAGLPPHKLDRPCWHSWWR